MIKCVGFVVLLTLFQGGISLWINGSLPFYWGHEYLHSRMDHIERKGKPYDIMALGSSRVMCHMNPALMDSLLSEKGLNLKSFNNGLAGTFAPATYRFAEQILERKDLRPQYLLLELDWLMQPSPPDMHTTDYKYWYQWEDYQFGLAASWVQPDMRRRDKLMAMYGYSMSFLEKSWNIGLLKSAYEVYQHGPKTELLGLAGNGFINLEDAVRFAPNPDIRRGMAALREQYLADTTVMSSAGERAQRNFEEAAHSTHSINPVHKVRIDALTQLAASKGVHLIWLLSPRVYAPDLLALFRTIDPRHRIELSDPRRFPEFYQSKYSFDDMHLNRAGAKLYTEALAKALILGENLYEPLPARAPEKVRKVIVR